MAALVESRLAHPHLAPNVCHLAQHRHHLRFRMPLLGASSSSLSRTSTQAYSFRVFGSPMPLTAMRPRSPAPGCQATGGGSGNNRFHFVGVRTLDKVGVQRGRYVVIRTGETYVVNKVCPRL